MSEKKIHFSDKIGEFAMKLAEPLSKFSTIKGIQAVTMGLMAAMPMTLIGSIFILLFVFSKPGMMGIEGFALLPFFNDFAGKFMEIFRLTLNFLSFWASLTIAQAYAELHDFDVKKAGMVGVLAFLLLATPGVKDGALAVGNFGADGLAVAMLSSVWMTKLFMFLDRKNFKLRLPDTVPGYVGESFGAIVPMLTIAVVCWLIRFVADIDLVHVIQLVVSPIRGVAESLPFYLFISVIISIFWFCGLHGNNLTSAVTKPLIGGFLAENAAAKLAGAEVLPHIWISTTLISAGMIGFYWVVTFLLMRSKVDHLKAMGKAIAVPMFFCVQEPIVFGVPLVFNSYLLIPWILTTIVNGAIIWLSFSLNLVTRGFIDPSWACPAPLGVFLSTGGDFRSLILLVVVFVVGYVITKPFFKAYEKAELERVAAEKAE